MCDRTEKTWNSLEVMKLLVSASIPIVVLAVGAWINQGIRADTAARQEASLKQQQRWENEHAETQFSRSQEAAQGSAVVRERVKLWSELAYDLNDMYAYFMYVGTWKELNAAEIVAKKRKTDRTVYSFRPFFSDEFFNTYQDFMKTLFKTNRAWGKDAGLRTTRDHRSHESDYSLFIEKDNSDSVHEKYFALLDIAAREMKLEIKMPKGRPPRPPKGG